MRLLENHRADAEQRGHDGDAEPEAARQDGRADRPRRERAKRDPENHPATTMPLFIASRRPARAATTGLCVTTTMAVPSA